MVTCWSYAHTVGVTTTTKRPTAPPAAPRIAWLKLEVVRPIGRSAPPFLGERLWRFAPPVGPATATPVATASGPEPSTRRDRCGPASSGNAL